MESQVKEADVSDKMEIVNCEKPVIDEETETIVCNEVPALKPQQDVIVDVSHNSEEDKNSMLLEIDSSKSQSSEILSNVEGNFNF